MKTIAQQIKWDFETDGNLIIKDKNGNLIYFERSCGYWAKYKYDSKGKEIYWEDPYRNWTKKEYDSKGNEIYYEHSNGFWQKYEYDSKGNEIYYENANGTIRDKRPKPFFKKKFSFRSFFILRYIYLCKKNK